MKAIVSARGRVTIPKSLRTRRALDPGSILERIGDDRVRVTIRDFISPSILERLSRQEGVLSPQVTDWRAMVDSVFIDASYDGDVFDVALADIPERKQDLVAGAYEVEVSDGASTVAVKMTDMLGEEVLVTLALNAVGDA